MLYHFKVTSFNSHAVLQRLELCYGSFDFWIVRFYLDDLTEALSIFQKQTQHQLLQDLEHLIEYEKQGLPIY